MPRSSGEDISAFSVIRSRKLAPASADARIPRAELRPGKSPQESIVTLVVIGRIVIGLSPVIVARIGIKYQMREIQLYAAAEPQGDWSVARGHQIKTSR